MKFCVIVTGLKAIRMHVAEAIVLICCEWTQIVCNIKKKQREQ